MTAGALILGFGLVIVHPFSDNVAAVQVKTAFHTEQGCFDRRDELLAAPRFRNSFLLVDCEYVWATPGEFDAKEELGT